MSVRRSTLYAGLTLSLAAFAFSFGSWTAHRSMAQQLAGNDARVTALREEIAQAFGQIRPAATSGANGMQTAVLSADSAPRSSEPAPSAPQSPIVEEVKRQIQAEMGLLPVRLLRDRRDSFVELNSYDAAGKSSYGTAGYLGNGYFVTVKHAVVALDEENGREAPKITSVKLRVRGHDMTAKVVDTGDAEVEVDEGDWAIVHVSEKVDLPPLRVNTGFTYDFAEPIFRLGNDYSKGIILSTGYIGQRQSNGLVTCLTDGHPGVSGGGVLNQGGDLVGIPIGRMQGDYRFSFILPVRDEMFRKVPALATSEGSVAHAGE